MCGFTGFFAKNTKSSRTELHVICQAMTDTLSHRGPDGAGLWQDPDIPVVLGHRRLSIIDLSKEGAQPMVSASDRYVITYNGEIYNFPDIQKELSEMGVPFRGRSDTEVFLAAIDQWGLNLALQKINGMFAFALWDRQERRLHLVRDRLGKKPLYVGWAGNTLLFASELKALRAHPDFKAEIDEDALALYMRYSCVPAPRCIYKNVWSLPAGHIASLDLSALQSGENLGTQMNAYWHHLNILKESHAHPPGSTEAEIIQSFDELLSTCVRERLVSDVPLGAFLSGGIDSSAVVALMQKISNRPVKTYSIGFQEAGFDEAPYAKKIAAHLGTDHHEMYLSAQEALDIIPSLPQMYDEPFGDISAIPTHLVSRFARESVTVALSGDGGDEMLGGYNRHIMGPRIWNKMNAVPGFLRGALARGIHKIPTTRWDKMRPSQPQFGTRLHKFADIIGLESEEEIYESLLGRGGDAFVKAHPAHPFLSKSDYAPNDMSFGEKMMYWDALTYLPNDILTKLDRASMAVSLECRAPLLDRRIYDFVWGLPEHYKVRKTKNGVQGKWLLRQILNRYVPTSLFERPKQGFAMPVGEWLRGPLRPWAEELLSETALINDGLLQADKIRETWNNHQNGHGNHADALWNVLIFQSWKQHWM
ncbi:MAG: asparagine synthase (glutamine-hydrolyzing) [Alphaproteobacteria bacterium]|nr:asparagine synthase (glutamine-hydrolyzing) [Alphaproteobacteria bacterium]